jgi:pimeloyl-CoA synthetase
MAKLRYVDRMARRFHDTEPLRLQGATDVTVEEMETTVADFYQKALEEQQASGDLALDTDLADIFKVSRRRKSGVRPAGELVKENRKAIVDKVAYWTGVQRPVVKKLVESIASRVEEMNLRADIQLEKEHLTEIAVYTTALAMNYLTRGKFIQP